MGDRIDARYRVLGQLGSGGFSKVYHVHDDLEDSERALKVFESARGYEAVRREIKALRRTDHPT
jgi:serine/threonine protein kinase